MAMNINIHVTVSSNSKRYFDYVRESYIGLCSNSSRLRFYAYCLDGQSYRAFSQNEGGGCQAIPMEFGRGSMGHAKSIDTAITNLVADEINIISDTDIVMLRNGWDLLLDDLLLKPSSYGIVGVPYETVGGFSSGNGDFQTYKRIPTATWMALSPRYDFSRLTVIPDKENCIDVASIELSSIFNLPIGSRLLKDVGWQIPLYLHEHKIPYLAFEIIKPGSPESKALKGCNPYHDEFQFGGQPLIAHQRGSMKHRFRIDPLSVDFYDACDRYLNQPSWTVFPTTQDRIRAFGQDIVGMIKRPLRALRDKVSP